MRSQKASIGLAVECRVSLAFANSFWRVLVYTGTSHTLYIALRRLWKAVPIYGEVSELVEYGEDFTDAATVVDGLQTAYIVGKGYADKVIEKTEEIVNQIENDKKINNKVSNKINKSDNKNIKSNSANKIDKIANGKKGKSKKLVTNQINHSDQEKSNLNNDESIDEFDKIREESIRPGKMVFRKNQK